MFVAGVTASVTTGRLFVLSGQSLFVGPDATVPLGLPGADWLCLGTQDGVPCFAHALAQDAGEPPPQGTVATPLRQLYGVLPEEDFAIATRALGLTAWDRDHRFCGRCGDATERSTTERMRVCASCAHASYPRISPAVIVGVEREGRLLLARNARTKSPFHSVLAGFVELGESLEECVARELEEEAGIAVRDIRYFGSQPWPLTNSLMVGFTAQWASGELRPDETEIFEAGWFAAADLPPLPGRLSIARALVDDFVRRSAR